MKKFYDTLLFQLKKQEINRDSIVQLFFFLRFIMLDVCI